MCSECSMDDPKLCRSKSPRRKRGMKTRNRFENCAHKLNYPPWQLAAYGMILSPPRVLCRSSLGNLVRHLVKSKVEPGFQRCLLIQPLRDIICKKVISLYPCV